MLVLQVIINIIKREAYLIARLDYHNDIIAALYGIKSTSKDTILLTIRIVFLPNPSVNHLLITGTDTNMPIVSIMSDEVTV